MIKSLSTALLLSLSFFVYPVDSFSQDWAYLGHSTKPGESRFYIFTLSEEGENPGELKITQKHVFSIPQKLGTGETYNSVLITRSLKCSDKMISVDKAVFSNGVGSTVGTYENKAGSPAFEAINKGKEIDMYVLNKYCADG